MTNRTSLLGALGALSLAVVGCGGSKVTGNKDAGGADGGAAGADGGGGDVAVACPEATGQGSLKVTVTGLPTGVTPMVRVMGGKLAAPMVLTPGTAIKLDAGGGYQLAWRRVKVAPTAPAIIGKAFYLSNKPFDGCIKVDETVNATLEYTQEPGSEKAWVTESNPPVSIDDKIAGYNGGDLTASATKNPAVIKSKNFTGRGGGGALDSSGNLWVPGGDRVNMYAMATLAMTSDAAPAVTLTQPAGASANFAAFDASGNLWVSRGAPTTERSVARYDAGQLAASGSPTPSVVVKPTGLMNPAGIAFDVSGDLWIADEASGKVLMVTAAHLASSFSGAADVTITAHTAATAPVAAAYDHPNPIAFDKNGDLWVGSVGTLFKVAKAQQVSGDLAGPPALNWASGEGAFAFDESGGLWMGGPTPGKFQRLPKTQLDTAAATNPAPTADIVIDSSAMLGYAESIVIDPSPSWSNLHDDF
jgi:hypothetical protein